MVGEFGAAEAGDGPADEGRDERRLLGGPDLLPGPRPRLPHGQHLQRPLPPPSPSPVLLLLRIEAKSLPFGYVAQPWSQTGSVLHFLMWQLAVTSAVAALILLYLWPQVRMR